jgi:hypothetical protein
MGVQRRKFLKPDAGGTISQKRHQPETEILRGHSALNHLTARQFQDNVNMHLAESMTG